MRRHFFAPHIENREAIAFDSRVDEFDPIQKSHFFG
jgi:hypothetical protein